MKLHVIDFSSNSDLPESVRAQIPDEEARTSFRTALNAHLRDGKSEMHAYVKAWRALSDAGYAKTDAGWVRKDGPTVGDVHVNRPLGSKKKNPFEGGGNFRAEDLNIPDDASQKRDVVSLDVPLFLKLLEDAREEIKGDEPLHVMAERVIALGRDGALDMSDYASIVDAIKKYSSDQPRDEQGRFGEGGNEEEEKSKSQFYSSLEKGKGYTVFYHVTPTKNIKGIKQNGLRPDSDGRVYATVGGTSKGHVFTGDNSVVAFRVPHSWSSRVVPDHRYGTSDASPFTALIREHKGIDGADVILPGAIDSKWIITTFKYDSKVNKYSLPETIFKRISGNSGISLNAEGRELAKRLGERIALKGGLDVLYSSTLPRGIETADAVAKADENVHRAAAIAALCPWHLGEIEGQEPDDVHHLVDHYLENVDERPPGKGADGKPAETFREAEKRQLDFYAARLKECEEHPTLKVGAVVHSRSMELAQAWNDDGCPKDYATKLLDLEHPRDPLHADVLRWHAEKIKEIDLDSDDELKPGFYLILHSLTDDDTDGGNTELEKGGPGSGPRPGQRKAAQVSHGKLLAQHDAAFAHAGRVNAQASDDKVAEYKGMLYGLHAAIEAHGKEFGAPAAADAHMANATNALMTRGNTIVGREASLMHMHNAVRAIGHSVGVKKIEKAERPPHLRTTATPERCANCDYFDAAGHCKMYGNYPVSADQVCDDWTAKAAEKGGDPEIRKYLPPLEVLQACKRASDAGIAVLEVTSSVVEGDGLDEAAIRKIDEHFKSIESHSDSPAARDAWGGRHASRWSANVLKKLGKLKSKWTPWIAVDLDGTLAEKTDPYDPTKIGAPRAKELARVKADLADGKEVRVFTARVADDPDGKARELIEAWCVEHVGRKLPVTNEKDPGMIELRDDLAVPLLKAGSGIMLAFWPDAETQKHFAVDGGEKPEDIHVTLAYFGKLAEFPLDAMGKLEDAVEAFAKTHGPVEATLGGIGRFPATPQSDGKDVAYLGVHGDCQKFRQELVDACEAAGAEPKFFFGWNPHATLKMVSPHAPHLIPTPDPKAVTFDEIVLSVGGAKKAYKLTGVNKWDDDSAEEEDSSESDDASQEEDAREDADKVELRADIVKLDAVKHLCFGWFSVVKIGDRHLVDTQGDLIVPETIETAAYKFVLTSRKGGEMHEQGDDGVRGVGQLVESVVFTKEKVNAMIASLAEQGIPAVIDLGCEAWWGGFFVEDPDTWKKVTTGELKAWSIGGRGKRAAMAA